MKERFHFNEGRKLPAPFTWRALLLMAFGLTALCVSTRAQDGKGKEDRDGDERRELIRAEQPSAPCTPNQTAARDVETVARRGDVVSLPEPLETRILQLAARPHTYLPIHAFAEADKPSSLFQYYLIDSNGFQPNPRFPASTITQSKQLPTKPTAASPPSELCVWLLNLSQVCRPMPITLGHSSMYSPTSLAFL